MDPDSQDRQELVLGRLGERPVAAAAAARDRGIPPETPPGGQDEEGQERGIETEEEADDRGT